MSDYSYNGAISPLIPGDNAFSDIAVTNNARIYNNLAVDGTVFLRGSVRSFSTIDSTSVTTGSFITAGGVGIAKQLFVGSNETILGNLYVTSTTLSTSATTGSVVVTGGLGVAGTLTATTITDGTLTTTRGQVKNATITDPTDNVAANYLNARSLSLVPISGSVQVSNSAAPATGNVLIATSATAATWQPQSALTGVTASLIFAEYVQLTNANGSVPPGTAFTVSTPVYTSPSIVASSAAGGTAWTLANGTYIIDFEMSNTGASSSAIYIGPSVGSLAIDYNTVAGSSTSTSWIHGRAIETVASGVNNVVIISSVVGTANVPTAGSATGIYMVRVTFLKIA